MDYTGSKTKKGYQVLGEEKIVELKPAVSVSKNIDETARNQFILNLLSQDQNKTQPSDESLVEKIVSKIQNAVSGKTSKKKTSKEDNFDPCTVQKTDKPWTSTPLS